MRSPRFFLSIFCIAAALTLSGCFESTLDKQDPIAGLTRDDFEEMRKPPAEPMNGPPVPHLALQLDRDDASRIASNKILSISVNEKIPLKDMLLELAGKAGVDIEIDPRIEGSIIFTATRQSFPRILNRLCRIAGLRYTVEDGVVRVELDEPYLKTYALDYLSLSRKADSQIGIATNVFAAVQGGGKNGGTAAVSQDAQNSNNSLTKVDTSGIADFWPEVESNIQAILENTRSTRNRSAEVMLPAQLKQEGISTTRPFVINRQAGLVSVFGTKNQHLEISTYLDRLRRNVNAQVLIEARIVEVGLDENYKSGINWRTLMDNGLNAAARFGPAAVGAPFSTATTATNGVVTLSLKAGDFAGILNFVRGFGTTRTLSSPRLTVLNNQPAVLKVARNEVYFTSTVETTPIIGSSGGSPVGVTRTVNSTPNTVPIGFLMTVQPAVNLDRNEVTLNLRPTVSFIVDRVEDPGVKIAAADANVPEVSSSIPVVAVREMDSVLTLPSGTVAVMGGLMQDSSGNLENGVPFADEIPILGNMLKSRDNSGQMSELVILLRASIVDGGPEPDAKDRDLYHRYTQDDRPLPMRENATGAPESVNPKYIPAAYVPMEAKEATLPPVLDDSVEAKPIQVASNDLMNERDAILTDAAYYKVKRKKKPTPPPEDKPPPPKADSEEETSAPDADEDAPAPKKKKNWSKRSGAPQEVSPPFTPPPPMPPTIQPDYDRRPDTMPED